MIALTIPQRCSRIIREVFTTGSRPWPSPATGAIRPAPRSCSDSSRGSRPKRPGRSGGCLHEALERQFLAVRLAATPLRTCQLPSRIPSPPSPAPGAPPADHRVAGVLATWNRSNAISMPPPRAFRRIGPSTSLPLPGAAATVLKGNRFRLASRYVAGRSCTSPSRRLT